jgi:hypothetical protein
VGRYISHPSIPTPGPSTLLYFWYQGSLPGLKLPGFGVQHTPHLAPSLKKGWNYTITPFHLLCHCGMLRGKFAGVESPTAMCLTVDVTKKMTLCVCVCVCVGERFLTLQRRCVPSKHQKPLIQSHSIVSQKTPTLNHISSYSRNCTLPTDC